MAFPALEAAQGRLNAKRSELAGIFAEAGPDLDMNKVKSISGDSAAKVDHIRALNEEIDSLGVEVEGYQAVAKAADRARADEARHEAGSEPDSAKAAEKADRGAKSLGDLFVESLAYKGRQRSSDSPVAELDVDVKADFTTAAGWAPETTRTGKLVDFATTPIQVVDIIPGNSTSQAAVVYMEETTFTNAAAEVAEGGNFPESALALTEKSSPVRKIATWIPVTDEQLEDVPQARGYINNRLPFMIRQKLDSQILVGSGTAPALRGILNTAGIQTQAKGTDPTPDAVYKAMVLIQTTGQANPNAVVMNPLDWQDVRLLRTTEGIYLWGSPSDAGPARIWGLPVVMAQALTVGTGLVGDFSFSELATRRGMDVQVSNSHSTFFIQGKQAVRADMRVALTIYRPTAFVQVTGI